MLIAAYLGPEAQRLAWDTLTLRHASNIGMQSHTVDYPIRGNDLLLLTWFIPANVGHQHQIAHSDGAVIFVANPRNRGFGELNDCGLSWDELLQTTSGNMIKLGVHLTSGEIRVNVPAATPEQCFFSDSGEARVISNDMRFVIHWAGFELDDVAVQSLFQFGVVPPHKSVSRKVGRIPAGNTLVWPQAEAAPRLAPIYRFTERSDGRDAEQRVLDVIDRIVDSTPDNSILLFSGGVDSGLLAARFAAKGRRDLRLVNFAFSADDPQGDYASQVAESLGFDCQRVLFDMRDIRGMLDRIGREYSFPFVDSSSLPTNLLVEKAAAVAGEPTVVIDGTGADGEFGTSPGLAGWSRVHRVPKPFRTAIGHAYDALDLWRHSPTKRLEFLARAFRQSARYSLGKGVFCQNSLDGIAYARGDDYFEETVFQAINEITAELSPESAFSYTDVIQVCAGRFAAKSFDPLRSRGMIPRYPFLETELLQLSLTLPWDVKCHNGEQKSILKRILAKAIPLQLVYRQKSGFRAPMRQIMATGAVQDYLRDVALAAESPLTDLLQLKVVTQMVDDVRRGQEVAQGVHNLLWCLIFVSAWLDQSGFSATPASTQCGTRA